MAQCKYADHPPAEGTTRPAEDSFFWLADIIQDALLVVQRDRIMSANRAALRLLGVDSPDRLRGVGLYELFRPSRRNSVRKRIHAVVREGRWRTPLKERVVAPDGDAIDVELFVFARGMSEGEAIQILLRDVSGGTRSEVQAATPLEERSRFDCLRALSELAANMSYQLFEPLQTMSAYADCSMHSKVLSDPKSLHRCLAAIRDQAHRAGELLRAIHSFFVPRLVHSAPALADVNLIIRQAVLRREGELQRRNVQLTLDLAGDLPLPMVVGEHVQRVVENIIDIAALAMAQSPADLRRLSICTEAIHGGVRVNITHAGRGIDPSTASWWFDPSRDTTPSGSGLDLAISRALIEAYGGRIDAHPGSGSASAFSFALPIPQREVAP